jgi:hypothetical protein
LTEKIPLGWFDVVHNLRLAILREYPTAIVRSMSYDRGWLSIEVDDSDLDVTEQAALGRLVQGFVTQSLSTCMCCGSGYGRDRGARNVVTCDSCETTDSMLPSEPPERFR